MSRSFVIVATPFESVPVGGFLRDAKVLPYFSHALAEMSFEAVLHIPANSIAASIMLLVNSGMEFEDAVRVVYRDAYKLRKLNLSTPLLEDSLCLGEETAWRITHEGSTLRRIRGFGPLYVRSIVEVEKKLVKRLIEFLSGKDVVFVYSMNESVEHFTVLYELCGGLRSSCGVMLQQPLYRSVEFMLSPRISPVISSIYLNSFIRKRFLDLVKRGYLKILLSVSPAPFLESEDLVYIAKRYGVKIAVPYPANAVDPEIFKYRSTNADKPPIAVYFGRIYPGKGCFDLVEAWSTVEKEIPEAELWVIGSFASDRVKYEFFKNIKELKLRNVRYLGYIRHREKLYETVSKAKLLMYPSYEDAFPLTVLEALALGLTVVAYDIPAIKYVYGGLKPVKIVGRGDVVSLARQALELLKADPETLSSMLNDEQTMEFIKLHSSWRNVALAEFKAIKAFLM